MGPETEAAGTTLLLAAAVARTAHAGQTDKAGQPYLAHPARVAAAVAHTGADAEVQAAAWLHDVVEDTSVTLDDLTAMGFSRRVVDAVDALTRREHESHEQAVRRAAANPDARIVKRCDVNDNANPDRLALLDEATRARLARKYAHALDVLADPAPRVNGP